jgi:hypothetical protein
MQPFISYKEKEEEGKKSNDLSKMPFFLQFFQGLT